LAELECQALADEARYGEDSNSQTRESKPRKVVFNSSDDIWDFRNDLEIPWLSEKLPKTQQKQDATSNAGLSLGLQSSVLTSLRKKNENSSNYRNEFV